MTIYDDDNKIMIRTNELEHLTEYKSSNPNERTTVVKCNWCAEKIRDQYYYVVDGLSWHSSCLRCSACHMTLTNMNSCFCRNNKIWCRKDYDRQFRCQKCSDLLKPSDLIMRSGTMGSPYHVGCFRCDICNVLLLAGDSYGCYDNQLLCKLDLIRITANISASSALGGATGTTTTATNATVTSITTQSNNNSNYKNDKASVVSNHLIEQSDNKKNNNNWIYSSPTDDALTKSTNITNGNSSNGKSANSFTGSANNPLSALCQLSMNEYIRTKLGSAVNKFEELIERDDGIRVATENSQDLLSNEQPISIKLSDKCASGKSVAAIATAAAAAAAAVKIKSEKLPTPPSSNNEQDDKTNEESNENLDELSELDCIGKEFVDQGSLNDVSTIETDEEASQRSCSETDEKILISANNTGNNAVNCKSHINSKKAGNNLRQKRVRTSFKHQQLRTMKAYFAMNHNPDSKDLRQLSQKTGLSKRVLQVWFQNARAKFRRSLCRQSGVICNPNTNQMMYEESLISMDKNGNYTSKSKVNNYNELTNTLVNHNIPTNHRICSMQDINGAPPISSGSLLPSLANLRDNNSGYLPNGKHFIPVTNTFYNNNNSILNIMPNSNSPSIFPIDLNTMSAIDNFNQDNNSQRAIDNANFQLTELGINHKIPNS